MINNGPNPFCKWALNLKSLFAKGVRSTLDYSKKFVLFILPKIFLCETKLSWYTTLPYEHKIGYKRNLPVFILFKYFFSKKYLCGPSPFCKQTEMDLTPFAKKVNFLCHFCSRFNGNFNFSLVSSYRATKNLYIETNKSNLMKNGPNPFCKRALQI